MVSFTALWVLKGRAESVAEVIWRRRPKLPLVSANSGIIYARDPVSWVRRSRFSVAKNDPRAQDEESIMYEGIDKSRTKTDNKS